MLRLLQGAIIRCSEVQDERVAFARVMSAEPDRLYASYLDDRNKIYSPQVNILSFNGDTWVSMFAQRRDVGENKFILEPIGPIRFRDIDAPLTTCPYESTLVLATLNQDIDLNLVAVSRQAAAFETNDLVPLGTTGTITMDVANNTFNVEATTIQQLITDETTYLICNIRNLTRIAQATWDTIATAA